MQSTQGDHVDTNKVPYGTKESKVILNEFFSYLEVSLKQLSKSYCIAYRTLYKWTNLKYPGGPDLKNHFPLLFDLFGWYLVIPEKDLLRKRDCEKIETYLLLEKYRKYLGLTKVQVAKTYTISKHTYRAWEENPKRSGPDLKNHPVFLRDFFIWYFNEYRCVEVGESL